MIRIAQVTVSLERREVFAGSRPVKLGSRAFDILALLIEARGALVSKDELLAKVWPHSVVEENNLQVHISVLRKVLGGGRDLIKTIPGRGYRLVLDAAPESEPEPSETEAGGRDRLLIALLQRLGLEDMLQEHRPAAPAAIAAPPSAAARSSMEPPAATWWQGPGVTLDTPTNSMDTLVYIVDDESSVRTALSRLLRSAGIASKAFACAEDFLLEPFAEQIACLVLDVNLQAGSGFDLQQALHQRGSRLPIIFMTGYGTIPLSVKAIKAGAQEFLTKPFDENQLLEAVDNALNHARRTHASSLRSAAIRRRFDCLTPRERQVLALLVSGRINKQIAHELGTREVTTKVHKKHIMTKMNASTLIELVQMCESIGFEPALYRAPIN
jgi:FixJ family two-component response regulator/DNA-binding winged helix-turn-helix (wHTH) protein